MQSKPNPLLCELHAHTTWSDGALGLRELCDLYGRRGFDVLAVTDHATRERRQVHAGRLSTPTSRRSTAEAERERATLYDLLVIPGLELTYDDPTHSGAPRRRGRVALVRRRRRRARGSARASAREGAALVAAHPYSPEQLAGATRRNGGVRRATASSRPRRPVRALQPHTLFEWVAAAGHAGGRQRRLPPARAPRDLEDAPAVRERSEAVGRRRTSGRRRPAYLVRLEEERRLRAWRLSARRAARSRWRPQVRRLPPSAQP